MRLAIPLRVKKKFRTFILEEKNLPPLMYFLIFIYIHCRFQSFSQYFHTFMVSFALLAAAISNLNLFYMLTTFLYVHPAAAIPLFALFLFFCNEKWKLYLFIFAIGDNVFSSDAQDYFLAIFSLLICFQIYRDLLFKNTQQNVQYFIGMASIASYYSFSIIQANFKIGLQKCFLVILVIASASLAHTLIKYKLQNLSKANPEHIYSPRFLAHYLNIIQKQAAEPYIMHGKMHFHRKRCHIMECFCQSTQEGKKANYFIRQLYKNAVEHFRNNSQCLLFQNYVDLLLKESQIFKALHFINQWQTNDYFSFVAKQRALSKVENVINRENSSNFYELQYAYALEYDKSYHKMLYQINDIVKLKLKFWREVNRKTSLLIRMQKLGKQIIDRMYQLNIFYNKVIKSYENSLFLFDATVLYGMFMLSTTNFKEYAQEIIKNTAKVLEEVHLYQTNISQIFAIRSVIVREQNSFIDNQTYGPNTLRHLNNTIIDKQINRSTHKLLINAVSNGFCKIIGVPYNQLIGRELNQIIPDGYKEVHHARLYELLDMSSKILKETSPSKFLHQQLKLPIKCANGGLVIAYICIKITIDVNQGFSFTSVIKLCRERSYRALISFQGQLTDIEQGFNADIIKHSQVQRYLQKLRMLWKFQRIIPQQNFNLMINTVNYGINLSSPLLGLFLQKQKLKDVCPPIHIEIINEQAIRNQLKQNKIYNKNGAQIRKMDMGIINYDVQSSTKSHWNGSSAITILNTFAQMKYTPIYRLLQIVFFVITIAGLLSNIAAYFLTQLPWDVTSPKRNPINDTMNLYALQMLTIKALYRLGAEQSYLMPGGFLNKTRVSQYFGDQPYQVSIVAVARQLQMAYKDSIKNVIWSSSKLLQPYIDERLNTPLAVANPTTIDQLLSSSVSYQNLTYLDLLMIYATDLNLMTQLQLDAPVIGYSFTVPIGLAQNCSHLSPIIDSAVKDNQFTSIAVHISLMTLIAFLLIPLHILFRKRLQLHQKVFDLLVSIDSEQISCEMRSLQQMQRILRNYQNIDENIKANVIAYQQNVIHHNRSKRYSSDNQMLVGLEIYESSDERIDNMQKNIQQIGSSFQDKSSPFNTKISKAIVQSSMHLQKSGNIKSKNLFNSINEDILNIRVKRQQSRKRSGQLDFTGSVLDPSKKIIKDQCVLYLLILSSLISLGLSISFKLEFDTAYLDGKNELIENYADQIDFYQKFISAKVMYGLGSTFFASFFGAPEAKIIFVPMITSFPRYFYDDRMEIHSQIKPNCQSNASLNQQFYAKFCQYEYSEVILRGQFGTLFKQFIQLRYMVDNRIGNLSAQSIIQNISEKNYYMDSLALQLQGSVLKKVNLIFQSTILLGKEYINKKELLLVASILWSIFCFLYGMRVIVRMKDAYFKEVFMLTFLNNQMIIKNKRVESFLDMINKNSST